MNRIKLNGLVAATHTPFTSAGELELSVIEKQAEHLLRSGVQTVFIAGTTGEGLSLEAEERRQLAERWMQVAAGSPLRVIIHVGSTSLATAKALAAQAGELGALAISALAPSYFKPGNLGVLVEWCAEIAAMAPQTPFYYYDIPAMTSVNFSMPEFLNQASDRIPTLNGIKFTHSDLMAYQSCLRLDDGAFDIPWGTDESLLGALALGARGAVGSSYNFAAPLYHQLIRAFDLGNLAEARELQFRSVQLIRLLTSCGYMGASKAVMGMLGVEVGPARLPNSNLTPGQCTRLRGELERLGFFDWILDQPSRPSLSSRPP